MKEKIIPINKTLKRVYFMSQLDFSLLEMEKKRSNLVCKRI